MQHDLLQKTAEDAVDTFGPILSALACAYISSYSTVVGLFAARVITEGAKEAKGYINPNEKNRQKIKEILQSIYGDFCDNPSFSTTLSQDLTSSLMSIFGNEYRKSKFNANTSDYGAHSKYFYTNTSMATKGLLESLQDSSLTLTDHINLLVQYMTNSNNQGCGFNVSLYVFINPELTHVHTMNNSNSTPKVYTQTP